MKLAAVIALIALCVALPAIAADATGKWKATVEGPNGNMDLVFDLKVDAGKVTGEVTSPMGGMKITEGKVEGDSIAFLVNGGDGGEFHVSHTGTISGDNMKLKAEVGDRTIEFTAKREPK